MSNSTLLLPFGLDWTEKRSDCGQHRYGGFVTSPAQQELNFQGLVLTKGKFHPVLRTAVCNGPSVSEAWYDAEEYIDGRWAAN